MQQENENSPNRIRIFVQLPESNVPIAVKTHCRSTARMLTNQLIEAKLLSDQYRYSHRFVDEVGRSLDSYTPLKHHPVLNGNRLTMSIRNR